MVESSRAQLGELNGSISVRQVGSGLKLDVDVSTN